MTWLNSNVTIHEQNVQPESFLLLVPLSSLTSNKVRNLYFTILQNVVTKILNKFFFLAY